MRSYYPEFLPYNVNETMSEYMERMGKKGKNPPGEGCPPYEDGELVKDYLARTHTVQAPKMLTANDILRIVLLGYCKKLPNILSSLFKKMKSIFNKQQCMF